MEHINIRTRIGVARIHRSFRETIRERVERNATECARILPADVYARCTFDAAGEVSSVLASRIARARAYIWSARGTR